MILYIPTNPWLINSFILVCFWRKYSKRIDLYASPVPKGLKEKIRLYEKDASIFNISKCPHVFSFLTPLVFFNIHVQIFFFSIYQIRVIIMISSYILFFLSISDNYWNLKMYPESDTNWYCHTVDNQPKLYNKWSFNFCFIFWNFFLLKSTCIVLMNAR